MNTPVGQQGPARWLVSETETTSNGDEILHLSLSLHALSHHPKPGHLQGTIIALCRCVLLIAAGGVLLRYKSGHIIKVDWLPILTE